MDWVAVYAAIVSTVLVAWTAYDIWRDRAAVKVEAVIGYITSPVERLGPLVIVTARNRGRRPVVLSIGGLLLKSDRRIVFGGDPGALPKRLEESESFQTWTYLGKCKEELRTVAAQPPIWAYWDTQGGKRYSSRLPKGVVKELLQ